VRASSKLGAIPWARSVWTSDACFVGVSLFRPLGSSDQMRASIAEAFNGRGDAIVLRAKR
jgi:hypothetical protein